MHDWGVPLAIALFALDAYAVLRAILRKSGVSATLAWLLAIIAFPIVGAIGYLLLAGPSIKRATRRNRPTARGAFRRSQAPDPNARGSAGPIDATLALAAQITGLPPTAGNAAEPLTSRDRAYEKIEAAVRAARTRIWAEYYIINNDITGRRFLDLLAEKARAGVEVKLLYDAVGSLRVDERLLRAIGAAGGKTAAFLPVNPFRRRWATHLRNHRKLVIVDDEIGFTGGMNVGDEYTSIGRRSDGLHFHDSHVALRGPAVADLAEIFCEDWQYAAEETLKPIEPPAPVGKCTVAIVPSGPDQVHNAHALIYFTAVATARRRVWLASPYFVPDPPMVQALISAALRGVDVRLLMPAHNDLRIVGWAARSYYAELIRGGVRIFEYQPAMLHAKRMVVDQRWSIVGSANVDIRSFRLNFEVGALIFDGEFAAG
ncbi:MAG: cardiolipin synthase, partial [Myxococcales bacterium]|nr:cardiolipin synthase [Myxococcales bacterium]